EPQQVCLLPKVAYFVVCHRGFHALGKISRPPQPMGIGGEQGPINGDREVFAFDDVFCPAEVVLPTLTDSRGILWRDIKRYARRSQIDAYPVNVTAALMTRFQPL